MEGYRVKEYGMPVKRYCQALDLKNNPELIAEYRKIHSRERFQECVQGSSSAEKWQLMERMFYLYES